MKLKLICYLKSGAVVSDELEFIEAATIEDVNDARVEFKKLINDGIKDNQSCGGNRKTVCKNFRSLLWEKKKQLWICFQI